MSVAGLQQRLRRGEFGGGAGLELVAGVALAAPRPSSALLRQATELAAALESGYPEMRVAVREAFVLSEVDLLRPEVALVRPLFGAPGAPQRPSGAPLLAVFIGDQMAPLRWRAQRCAQAGVLEAWTIALREGCAARWREPGLRGYRRREELPRRALLALDAAPERWLPFGWGEGWRAPRR